MPDSVALVLAFWCVQEPLKIGISTGFVFGLLVDIGVGAALGQHAFTVLLAYAATKLSRQVLWFTPVEQALQRAAAAFSCRSH